MLIKPLDIPIFAMYEKDCEEKAARWHGKMGISLPRMHGRSGKYGHLQRR